MSQRLTIKQRSLAKSIRSAFGEPTIEGSRIWVREYLSERQARRNPRTYIPDEGVDWLEGFAAHNDPVDILRRVPVSTLPVDVAYKLLPLLMTVRTHTRWRLGRGVSDCMLGATKSHCWGLVQPVVSSGSEAIRAAVCEYVFYCASCYEEEAMFSWRDFWKDWCAPSPQTDSRGYR